MYRILLQLIFIFIGTSTTLSQQSYIPSYTGIPLSPNNGPWGGASNVPNTTYSRIFYATPSIGSYNHAAMIDFHYSQFLATWKNAPKDEDSAGQRILYSQSVDGVNWTTPSILFPNISTNNFPVHLFAEPALHINGNLYAAASPIQFCIYPTPFPKVLLLRRVMVPGVQQLGPIFWASNTIPAGYEEASILNNIVTLNQTDSNTIEDISTLSNTLLVPCGPDCGEGEYKCEAVMNGYQDVNIPMNISGMQNEETHYIVPGTYQTNNQIDVLLYRNINKKLWFSVRFNGTNGNWTYPLESNLSDDVANINSGPFEDGTVYLVSNLMPNPAGRDPLFVTVSYDGWSFNNTHVVAACNMTEFTSPEQPNACVMRYPGLYKGPGPQYPQAVAVTAYGYEGLWVVFSMNKEDIWVARVPLTFY